MLLAVMAPALTEAASQSCIKLSPASPPVSPQLPAIGGVTNGNSGQLKSKPYVFEQTLLLKSFQFSKRDVGRQPNEGLGFELTTITVCDTTYGRQLRRYRWYKRPRDKTLF
jgi:hypothetical protein